MNAGIVYSNLTAVKSVEAAFRRKSDPELARIKVAPFLQAAENAFPHWVLRGGTEAVANHRNADEGGGDEQLHDSGEHVHGDPPSTCT